MGNISKKMFVVDCGTYPFDVMVYFGEDRKPMYKELNKYLDKETIKELKTFDYKVGKTIKFPSGAILIWLKNKPNCVSHLATLSHEIFHSVCFVLESVGITYCEKTDEAYAYLIEYLTKQIYNELDITFS